MRFNQQQVFSPLYLVSVLLALAIPGFNCFAQVPSSPEAKDVVAVQIRAQGVPCTKPTKAVRDIPDSSRDEMAWILTCKEATYRVKLIPHVGSRIEVIDDAEVQAGARDVKE